MNDIVVASLLRVFHKDYNSSPSVCVCVFVIVGDTYFETVLHRREGSKRGTTFVGSISFLITQFHSS
jgi:hypothetical protein